MHFFIVLPIIHFIELKWVQMPFHADFKRNNSHEYCSASANVLKVLSIYSGSKLNKTSRHDCHAFQGPFKVFLSLS